MKQPHNKPGHDTDDSTISQEPTLRERLENALHAQENTGRTTSSSPLANLKKRVYGQLRHREPPVPVNPIRDAPAGPFSYSYIMQRLTRGILEAQDADDFDEAVRLQVILWKMQDRKISPVEAARAAWLRSTARTD